MSFIEYGEPWKPQEGTVAQRWDSKMSLKIDIYGKIPKVMKYRAPVLSIFIRANDLVPSEAPNAGLDLVNDISGTLFPCQSFDFGKRETMNLQIQHGRLRFGQLHLYF
jgi:hypothetical protein